MPFNKFILLLYTEKKKRMGSSPPPPLSLSLSLSPFLLLFLFISFPLPYPTHPLPPFDLSQIVTWYISSFLSPVFLFFFLLLLLLLLLPTVLLVFGFLNCLSIAMLRMCSSLWGMKQTPVHQCTPEVPAPYIYKMAGNSHLIKQLSCTSL